MLPQSAFDWLKRAVPHPGNVPTYLAYAPRVPLHGEMRGFVDVAAELGLRSDQLSQLINDAYGINFNRFTFH